ncbi:putative bifunctional diguanylate cyclase/phosphodiesterase [Spongiibacter sp.]|uniref:putative bifunctional diguanylate cyclase/phosphodiesterase n=1 Tax=Spongiibacter sp. TaxID=2024860 RepID=UPI0035676A10
MSLRRLIRNYYSPAAAASLLADVRYIHLLASVGAAALMTVLWQDLPPHFAVGWFTALFTIQLGMTAVSLGFRQLSCTNGVRPWLICYCLLSALGFLLWGCLSLTFIDYLNLWQQILVLLMMFVLLTMSMSLQSRFYPLFCLNVVMLCLPFVVLISRHQAFDWQLLFATGLLTLGVVTLLIRSHTEARRHLDTLKKDPLTGLLNRSECLNLLAANQHLAGGLLVFRLHNYRAICDTFGNAAGDAALQHCANSLRYISEQRQLSARISENEFALLVDPPELQQWQTLGRQLLRQVGTQLNWGQHSVTLDSGLGLAALSNNGEAALRRAQLAATTSRQSNNIVHYRPELWEQLQRDITIRTALQQPEITEQLSLHFQIKQSLRDGSINGAEALLRWQHPQLGAVAPDEFIAIAEQSGAILALGDWVIRQATDCLLRIPGDAPFSIAVNVSMAQFTSDQLYHSLQAAMARLPAHRHLEIELTESVMMLDRALVRRTLQRLSALGVKISLDDFGTGYSSLHYLAELPIDILKIDRSFVANMLRQPKQRAIVKIIIEMAQALNITVVAEGVEQAEQLELLQQWQCNTAQGYFIARPEPGTQMLKRLEKTLHSQQL